MDHRHPGLHLILLVAVLACRPGPAPAEPVAPHFDEWDRLVDATAEGDLTTAKVVARDLTDGRHSDAEGAAAIGGALGFLQLASDVSDLAEGVASAAAACGACHAAEGVPPPALPPWSHPGAARRAVASLVWSDPTPPPSGPSPAEAAVAAAWTSTDPEARASAALASCSSCHSSRPAPP